MYNALQDSFEREMFSNQLRSKLKTHISLVIMFAQTWSNLWKFSPLTILFYSGEINSYIMTA